MAGLQWGLFMFVFMSYIFPVLGGENIKVDLKQVIVWTCGGIFFGLSMYFLAKLKIKKFDNN